MVEGCEICRLLEAGGDELIFQTEFWRVSLAPDQAYLGRAYVTLREHRSSLPELSLDQIKDWHGVVSRYEGLVWLMFGAVVFNWGCLMNNAFQDEEPRPHVHWHVRPRYAEAPILDGVAYPDPQFGHHYDRQYIKIAPPDMLARIGGELRAQL